MTRTRLLCTLSSYMMQEFSRRTVAGLKEYKLFKLLLPPLQSFLETNVRKEIEKDRFIIEHAGVVFDKGIPPRAEDRRLLLSKAQEIDHEFVRRSPPLPVAIDIRHQDIERIREQRMGRLLCAVYQLLASWEENRGFRKALVRVYDQQQFTTLLEEILALYVEETRLLSNSIRVPGKLSFARNLLQRTIYEVMDRTAVELARELAGKAYRRA